ncbi:MAG: thiamine phosphate synthase, partial [Candidatus Omnitrophica bacterium]|nr:thiamine phosphate synthase [Candidatus Omnitrophota bacterium]
MNWKKRSIKDCRLYAILDKDVLVKRSLLNTARKMLDAGVDIIQYRDKSSDKKTILKHSLILKKLLQKSRTIFIINDHVDIASLVDSDGVHLGQDDLSLGGARKLLGPEKIIGISCRGLKQALIAQNEGADYLGLGPVFSTPVKKGFSPVGLEKIREFEKNIRIPYFVIGGINCNNL